MARNRKSSIELTAYDDLFQTDESRAEAALSKIRDIPISEIDEFPDHPFKVLRVCQVNCVSFFILPYFSGMLYR